MTPEHEELDKGILYRRWCGMKDRCYNPNNNRSHRYMGRGITVCDEWRNDFKAFRDWAVGSGFKPGLILDRINNDGNYEPGNCRWVTAFENSLNRSGTTLFPDGKTVLQAARSAGISETCLRKRIRAGLSKEEALKFPTSRNGAALVMYKRAKNLPVL